MIRSAFCVLFHSLSYLCTIAQPVGTNQLQAEDSIHQTIHLSSSAITKDNKILLQWKSLGIDKNSYYIIERSMDKNVFEVIGAIKAAGQRSYFEFLDEKPLAAENYYRIKMQTEDQKSMYSQVITASIEGRIFCKFYPNPVDKLLILRSDYKIEIKITDALGKILILQYLQPGLQIVDVSCLKTGMYIITIIEHEFNHIIVKKLLKN